MLNSNLLYYLYQLATEYGGEVLANSEEVTLCFPSAVQSSPPKRQEDEPWPTQPPASASGLTTESNQYNPQTAQGRHRVLNDMDQFLKEQQLQQDTLERQQTMAKGPKFRTGELPYRNYADGRPPRP